MTSPEATRKRPKKVRSSQFKAPTTIPAIEGDFCAVWLRDVPSPIKSTCEIVALRVVGGEGIREFRSIVRPLKTSRSIRERAASVLDITLEELDAAPEVHEVFPKLSAFMGKLDVIVEESEQIELLIRCARYSGKVRLPNRICIAGGYGAQMLLAEATLDSIAGEHVSGPVLRFRHARRLHTAGFDSFVAFDTETTGLGPEDQITEIGAVKVVDGEVVDRFQTLVNPGIRIPARIQHFTGITNEMVAEGLTLQEAAASFKAFAGDNILVAHNANFDMTMLARAALPYGIDFDNDFFDTDSFSRAFKRSQEWEFTKLGYLAQQLNIPLDNAHRALADAEAAALVYLRLLDLQSEPLLSPEDSSPQ